MPNCLMRAPLAIGIVLIGAAISATAQETSTPEPFSTPGHFCSVATIAGNWAFRNNGNTPKGYLNGIGTIHIAKDGTVTGHGWITVGGVVSSETHLMGTTTVTPDCLSTGTFEGTPPFHCVVFANRTKMWCVYEAPLDITVTLEKIRRP